MFRKRTGPTKVFDHIDGCKVLKADPSVEIPWNEVETGYWRAECLCTVEHYREPVADDRVRLDPLDPATARHLGQCEYVSETDPTKLKILLQVSLEWPRVMPGFSATAAAPAGRFRT